MKHLLFIAVGIFMIGTGILSIKRGYFKLWIPLGKSRYTKDDDPVLYSHTITTYVVGGIIVVVLSILSWMGVI